MSLSCGERGKYKQDSKMSELIDEIDVLINILKPCEPSNKRRFEVTKFMESIICATLPGAQLFNSGSTMARTYLPASDVDLVLFTALASTSSPSSSSSSTRPGEGQGQGGGSSEEMKIVLSVFQALCLEVAARDCGRSSNFGMFIRNVEFINARTKVAHCVVNNLNVDVTINQAGALSSVVFIEECDRFINNNHLFKRSLILIKVRVWCCFFLPCRFPFPPSLIFYPSLPPSLPPSLIFHPSLPPSLPSAFPPSLPFF